MANEHDREEQVDAVGAVREVAAQQGGRRADKEEGGLHVAAEVGVALAVVEAEVASGRGELRWVGGGKGEHTRGR